MLELRKFKRYDARGRVTVKPQDGSGRVVQADLVDVSFLGLGVQSSDKIDSGVIVKFEIFSDFKEEPISGEGRIKHLREVKKLGNTLFRMGIEFVNVDKKLIQGFMRRIQTGIQAELRKKARPKTHSAQDKKKVWL